MMAPACDESKPGQASNSEPSPEETKAGDDDADKAIEAQGLPEVPQPSAAEVARHQLTHLSYSRWCKWCVAARLRNSQRLRCILSQDPRH